ncbi:peptidase S9 [Gemmatimonadetes bacterium T265]|nr:peptidase S9 [Gemmatimonadetes bacterium T265]
METAVYSPDRSRWAPVRRAALVAVAPAGLLASGRVVRAQPGTAALPGDPTRVTLERVFASRDFAPQPARGRRWLADGAGYTSLEPAANGAGGRDLVRYDAATGQRTVLVPATRLVPPGAATPVAVEDYAWSPEGARLLVFTNSQRVWRQNTRGDYWVVDPAGGPMRKLGGDAAPSTLMFAKFSPDGRRVAYVRDHDLYVEGVADGAITRLTRDGSRTVINGTFDWVYEEEFNLRDGFRWSPDGTRLAYWQLDASGVRDYLLVDDTDSLYAVATPVQYPKAGTTNSAARVGVVDAAGGPTRWLAVPGDPRDHYIARLEWAANSDEVVLQHLNRRQNTNEVMLGDARTGRVRTVLTERDSAWLDVVDDLRWAAGGRRFTWVSERDGWRHLYTVSRDGATTRLLTPGAFDLDNPGSAFGAPLVVGTDSAAGVFYFTASPENATQLYLYTARLDGRGAPRRVTPADQPGTHTYVVAPNGRWAFHTTSAFGAPPVTQLVRLPSHEVVRTLTDNAALRAAVTTLQRRPAEFFRVTTAAGVTLDGWMMTPPDFDPTKHYPVLFTVYGEPAAQTVLDAWGGAEYLWHLMLTQQGYVVASVDNRGTPAPRGRAFRKVIYGQIGVLNARDQAGAVEALLRQRPYLDPARVGVWGWSGGGATTLNLLFRYPALYRMGMAVAPVSDPRYYDTIYEERYMGLPQEDSARYRQAAAVSVAAGLRGDLLLVHGTGDDNVHYQNSEAVINALVAANKPFTMMAYPNRSHCICEGDNTSRHLFELLTRYLHEHLPAGVPAAEGARPAAGSR